MSIDQPRHHDMPETWEAKKQRIIEQLKTISVELGISESIRLIDQPEDLTIEAMVGLNLNEARAALEAENEAECEDDLHAAFEFAVNLPGEEQRAEIENRLPYWDQINDIYDELFG